MCEQCGEGHNTEHYPPGCPRCGNSPFHRRRIFSLSLGDWLDPEVPIEWLAEMLDTIRKCDGVNWLLLTKRPELWHDRMEALWTDLKECSAEFETWWTQWGDGFAPDNVWVGASVEDKATAADRISELACIPAKVRFLSCEPLLGPVDLIETHEFFHDIHWVIVGGESGPNARPCDVGWIRDIKYQCVVAGVPVFVKQMGAHVVDGRCHSPYPIQDRECWPVEAGVRGDEGTCRIYLPDPKGADPAEWPADLRVREFPRS